ncbi:hypothetical protein JOF56_001784 [Kibdelosporangium banguiense]|uniref:SH3 domain-containing protein n=1 Tax=Kibdelosporangium banguiense TaxID=1365924 RepID=A0ABS4TBN7_9PSEU|nr:hypothetical protein [Kibdelosporangium banguiense]
MNRIRFILLAIAAGIALVLGVQVPAGAASAQNEEPTPDGITNSTPGIAKRCYVKTRAGLSRTAIKDQPNADSNTIAYLSSGESLSAACIETVSGTYYCVWGEKPGNWWVKVITNSGQTGYVGHKCVDWYEGKNTPTGAASDGRTGAGAQRPSAGHPAPGPGNGSVELGPLTSVYPLPRWSRPMSQGST